MKVRHSYKKTIKQEQIAKESVEDNEEDDELLEEDEWDDVYDEVSRLQKKPRVRKAPKEWNEW